MRVISQYVATNLNAGPKAKVDIERILKTNYNAKIFTLRMNGNEGKSKVARFVYLVKKLFFLLTRLKRNELTIVQCPIANFLPLMNLAKNKIALIHDLEGLRGNNCKIDKKEIKFVNSCKTIICHNQKMKDYLILKGIPENKIYVLEMFDYLCDNKLKRSDVIKNVEVVYTGNLDKAPFLRQLEEEKMRFVLNVYGVGDTEFNNKKIIYKGKYSPDELPQKINGNIGLVWDGNYDETMDDSGLKNYTKYNCPHKLSCYLASGIPVIVWDKAASADFVKKNNIGYVISNIYEINDLKFDDYKVKIKNASIIGKNIREGYYTKKVIDSILKDEERRMI
jgi:hypothetical protein